jgi:hypothetical protein
MAGRFLPVNEGSDGRKMELRRRDAIFSSIGGSAFTKSVRPSLLASLVICACAPGANSNDAPKTATQNTVTTIAKLAGLDLRFPIDFYCGRQFYEAIGRLALGKALWCNF